MPWIEKRRNGFVVRDRDARGKVVGEYFATRAEADEKLRQANATREMMKYTAKLDPLSSAALFLNDIDGAAESEDPEFAFAAYCRTMIAADKELRASTRELYERNVRNHIEGTTLGRLDIRRVSAEQLNDYWGGLDLGVGALRNVQQLLSKAFKRALRAGLIDYNPLERSDVKRPSKERREEVVPLTVDELELLAASAMYSRDRLEILVMGYGGLRAGEVAGLRLQDIDFKKCALKLRQQVVRVTNVGMYVSDEQGQPFGASPAAGPRPSVGAGDSMSHLGRQVDGAGIAGAGRRSRRDRTRRHVRRRAVGKHGARPPSAARL
jgi:integrase